MGRRTKVLVAVVLVALVVHGLGLRNQFAGDDHRTILTHPAVSGGEDLSALVTYDALGLRVVEHGTLFRPITTATYRLDWWLGGGSPLPFHLTSIALFMVLCLVIYRFARRWLSDSAAFATVFLFAAMPIHVEAVANATGRSEILSLIFGLLALELATPKSLDVTDHEADERAPERTGRYLLLGLASAALYGASLLCKESSFLFPGIAAWLVFSSGGRSRQAYIPVALMGLVTTAYLVFRLEFLTSTTELAESGMYILDYRNPLAGSDVSLLARLWTCCEVFGRYVILTLVPYELPQDFSYAAILPHTDPTRLMSWFGATLFAVLAFGAIWGLRRRNRCSAFIGGFAGSYVLVSNLLVIIGTIQGSRLFFGPSLWLALLFGLAVERFGHRARRSLVALACSALLLGYGWVGIDATRCWFNDASRAFCAVETQPTSIYSHLWLGYAYGRAGDPWEALWHTAVHFDGIKTYPGPWAPPENVAELSAQDRVMQMTELLDRDISSEAWLLELEYYIRHELDSEPLAQFLRNILID